VFTSHSLPHPRARPPAVSMSESFRVTAEKLALCTAHTQFKIYAFKLITPRQACRTTQCYLSHGRDFRHHHSQSCCARQSSASGLCSGFPQLQCTAQCRALQSDLHNMGQFQVLLTTYEYIIKDRPHLSKLKWVHMIIG
jgi:hypothetical protein